MKKIFNVKMLENEWGVQDAVTDPRGLFVDNKNQLYVCDTASNRILVFDLTEPIYDEVNNSTEFAFILK